MKLRILLLSAALCLQGCAATSKSDEKQHAGILMAEDVYLSLSTAPQSLNGKGMEIYITGHQKDQDYQMKLKLELAGDKIMMTGATASDVQLFEYMWFGTHPFRLSKSPLAKDIDVRFLLSDFQLVYWPRDQLLKHLQGAQIVDKDDTRTLIRNGKPIVLIDYGEQITALEHLQRRYRITFKTAKQWDLNNPDDSIVQPRR